LGSAEDGLRLICDVEEIEEILGHSNYMGLDLSGTNFSGIKFNSPYIARSSRDVVGTPGPFVGAILKGTNFEDCNLLYADLTNKQIYEAKNVLKAEEVFRSEIPKAHDTRVSSLTGYKKYFDIRKATESPQEDKTQQLQEQIIAIQKQLADNQKILIDMMEQNSLLKKSSYVGQPSKDFRSLNLSSTGSFVDD